MTNKERQIQALLQSLDEDSMNFHNFDSALDYDSALNYDEESVLGMDEDSVLSFQGEAPKRGLSTFGVNMVYTAGVGSNPVTVELFGTDFNTGTVVGDTLTFTNGDDTVTVTGRTGSIVAFQNRLRYAPFRIKYARLNPINAAQFNEQIKFQMDSVYGGGKFNNMLPEEYFTPEQYQSLRVDLPMNYRVDSQRRIIMDIGATEVAPGLNLTFWIDQVVDEAAKLNGKSSIINMGGKGLQNPSRTLPTSVAISKLLKSGGFPRRGMRLRRGF